MTFIRHLTWSASKSNLQEVKTIIAAYKYSNDTDENDDNNDDNSKHSDMIKRNIYYIFTFI